jgi:hypothetical protein
MKYIVITAYLASILIVSACVLDSPNTTKTSEEFTTEKTEKKVFLYFGNFSILIGKDSVYLEITPTHYDEKLERYVLNPTIDTIFPRQGSDPFYSYLYNASAADMIVWRNAFIGHAPSTDTVGPISIEIQEGADTTFIQLSSAPIGRYKKEAHAFWQGLDTVSTIFLRKIK